MSIRSIPTFCMICLSLLSACAVRPAPAPSEAPETSRQFFAMNTLMSLRLSGPDREDALDAAIAEINRLDQLFSRTMDESDISRLNARAGDGTDVPLSPETADLLSDALRQGEETGGAFNITIAPIIDAWGFGAGGTDAYRVPSEEELSGLLPLTDPSALHVDQTAHTARLDRPGMEVDLGGIAKGYAADRLTELLEGYGVSSALLSLGSSTIALMGDNPSGEPWRVAVKDPQDQEEQILLLSLSDQVLSTSGAYEQQFTSAGVTYHHILDPETGYPADTGMLSVTVVADSGALTDAWSTALFVAGPEQALELWRTYGGFECILCLEDGRILITEGLEHQILYNKENPNDYTCQIVRR